MPEKIIGRKTSLLSDQLSFVKVMDRSDPLYDSEIEDEHCFYEVMDVSAHNGTYNPRFRGSYSTGSFVSQPPLAFEEFASAAAKLLREFLATDDCNEIFEGLKQLNCDQYLDLFVVTAVRLALDYPEKKQNRMSGLLMLLFARKILTSQHITRGFEKLVESICDIKLDIPNAADRIFQFIVWAIADKCLDEKYLLRLSENFLNELSDQTLLEYPKISEIKSNLRSYKAAIRKLEDDIFDENEKGIFEILSELGHPEFRHEFVRLLIIQSYDKTNREREIASSVLDCQYGKTLFADDIQLGFARLIGSIEDTQLDSPKSSDLLCKFLARAIVDDILAPSFLGDSYRLHSGGIRGMSITRRVQKWLTTRKHSNLAECFRKVWIGIDKTQAAYQQFKQEIDIVIAEYYSILNLEEAQKSINNMCLSPDQLIEITKEFIVFAMEKGADLSLLPHLVNLIKHLLSVGEIDNEIIIKGFLDVKKLIESATPGFAYPESLLQSFIDAAIKVALLPVDFNEKYAPDDNDLIEKL